MRDLFNYLWIGFGFGIGFAIGDSIIRGIAHMVASYRK